MALIAAQLGVIEESVILNMSFDWFQDVLDVMGEFVNYQAIVNYAGNAFCEKSWDMILDNNPVLKGQILTSEERSWELFFNTAQYTEVTHGGNNGKANDTAGAGSNGQGSD